jgi:hypothetical protein
MAALIAAGFAVAALVACQGGGQGEEAETEQEGGERDREGEDD